LTFLIEYRDPDSLPPPDVSFQSNLSGFQPSNARVAWSPDLGGVSLIDPEVASICREAAHWFRSQGCAFEMACPDLHDADHIFQVRRNSLASSCPQPSASVAQLDLFCGSLYLLIESLYLLIESLYLLIEST